jgi:hypothetical protein
MIVNRNMEQSESLQKFQLRIVFSTFVSAIFSVIVVEIVFPS